MISTSPWCPMACLCHLLHGPSLRGCLSGIGDPDNLSSQGIKTKVALAGVGENLQDHLAIGIRYLRKDVGPFARNLRLDRIALALAQAELFGTGFAAELPSRWTAFLRSTDRQPVPDIQLQFRAGPIEARPYLPPFTKSFPDVFTCRAIMLHPLSRGRIRLSSADPVAPVRIQHHPLRQASEMETLRTAFRTIRRLAEPEPVREFISSELVPGPDCTSDGQLDDYIRATVTIADHPAGTCKMGPPSDPSAVVDTHLRVRGVDGLRVVDASIMPDLTSGNIIAPIYMIAERISDHIRGRTFEA
jgi:4-pyridoxate dehydrogenase